MTIVGVIGLGAMGTPMAWTVEQSAFDLAVYNRTTERTVEFAEAGVKVTDSPRHLTELADAVIIMVSDGEAVEEVLERRLGILAGIDGDTTVIQMSTISAAETVAAAESIREAGGKFVDAPVFGTVGPAAKGTLTVLASGDREVVDEVWELFEVLGETVIYAGETGQGTTLKLAVNLLLGNMMNALAETLAFGAVHDLSPRDVLDALEAGPVDAPLFRAKGETILARNFAPHFPVEKQHKDLTLAVEAGSEAGLPLPQTAAARESFTAALARGDGDSDMSAVVRHLEETAGVELRDEE